VAGFDFVVNTARKCFYFPFNRFEARIDAGEALVDASEFASARRRECVYKTVHLSEVFLYIGEAFFEALFNTIKSVLKFIIVNM